MSCDCARQNWRIMRKEEPFLEKIKDKTDSWDSLYRCQTCGQFWELTYPGAGDVCCVEPQLYKMTDLSAGEEYGLGATPERGS